MTKLEKTLFRKLEIIKKTLESKWELTQTDKDLIEIVKEGIEQFKIMEQREL